MRRIVLLLSLVLALNCASTRNENFVIQLPKLKTLPWRLGIQPLQVESPSKLAEPQVTNYWFGASEKEDLRWLNRALYQTIGKNRLFKDVKFITPQARNVNVRLYWILRNYTVVASGSQVWVVADLAYCLTDQSKKVLFEDEFAVAGSCFHCLIGNLKMQMNAALINRVAQNIANWPRKKSSQKMVLANQYDAIRYYPDLDAAAHILPQEITLGQTGTEYKLKNIRWKTQLGLSDQIDWSAWLKD